MFTWENTSRPIVALAPMAGVTDASYRQFIKMIAPEVIVYTEFLSTDAIHYGAKKTLSMLNFDADIERPFIVQIFGNDREHFISSCKIIEEMGADGIDINMGCPAAKVVSSCHGSALIRRPELAADLVHAAVNAVKIPVSVKTRLGWESSEDLIPFCRVLEDAGAQCLTIHGRTYKQKFTGDANWEQIYELKKHLKIPMIGNGDINSAEDAIEKIKNLDGVMVGRGTMGNPWLLREIADALRCDEGNEQGKRLEGWKVARPDEPVGRGRLEGQPANLQTCKPSKPSCFQDLIPHILTHCTLAVKHKGEKRGIIEMRKHFAGYVKGFEGAKEMRMRLMETEKLQEVELILTSK